MHLALVFWRQRPQLSPDSHMKRQVPAPDVASSMTSVLKGLEISLQMLQSSPHETDTISARLPGFSTLPVTTKVED